MRKEKKYYERRNELSSWRPVALQNHHIYLCLFKLGYYVHALLSSVMYILSGENITTMYTMSRRRWDQNTTQVANRLQRAGTPYIRALHLPSLCLQLIFYNPVIENLSCSEATGKMPTSSIYLKNVKIEVFPPKLLNCGFHLLPWSECTTYKSVIFVQLSN